MINGAVAVVVWFVTLAVAVLFGMWAVWPTAEKHGWRRGYTEGHKRADREQPPALPKAGLLDVYADDWRCHFPSSLAPLPGPVPAETHHTPWVFAGGWDQGPVAAPAEKTLLTQTAELPEIPETGDETDSSFTRRMAREVEEMIAKWEGDTNYLMHTMKDVG